MGYMAQLDIHVCTKYNHVSTANNTEVSSSSPGRSSCYIVFIKKLINYKSKKTRTKNVTICFALSGPLT